ncbi:MAG: nucleoside deaminase [Bacteroidota bacterium]
MSEHKQYMKMAISEAEEGMRAGKGGPFGAVIVRDGEVIGRGHNTVIHTHDPTAHAEVNAIRDACTRIENHQLTGAVIYTNFEPCPMCLAAIYWSGMKSLYYSAGKTEAEEAGFMDRQLYREVSLPMDARKVGSTRIPMEEMDQLLDEWDRKEGKTLY